MNEISTKMNKTIPDRFLIFIFLIIPVTMDFSSAFNVDAK